MGERNETGKYVAVDMVDHAATRQLLDSPFLRTLSGIIWQCGLLAHVCVCVCVCVYVCVFVRPLVDISKQSLKGEVEGTKGDLQSTLHQNRDDGVRLHCAFFTRHAGCWKRSITEI